MISVTLARDYQRLADPLRGMHLIAFAIFTIAILFRIATS
jgi:hypothetical protein